jgi:type I restriction enzyme S subunit
MRNGWIETTLGEVADIYQPQTIAKALMDDSAEYIVYGANGPIGRYHQFNHTDKEVVVTCRGATCGTINMTPEKTWITGNAMVVHPRSDSLNKQFLFYALISVVDVHSIISGSAQPQITREGMGPVKISIPPPQEQKRIVDLISSVDSYIESLQQHLESAKKSRNAVLHELLTSSGDDWVETTLGEVAHLNPEQARDYDSDRLIKYIDLSTVTFDTGISSEIDQMPFNEAPGRARRIIRENDVIVSTVRPYLKGFAFVGKEFNGQIASTGFCVIRAKSESILSELVWALVGSDNFVDYLVRRSTGSNYPAVRPNEIGDFKFMLPPLHDQETVSQLIRTFDELVRYSSALIYSAQNLRSGLLSDLLNGEHEIPASYDKVMGAA